MTTDYININTSSHCKVIIMGFCENETLFLPAGSVTFPQLLHIFSLPALLLVKRPS